MSNLPNFELESSWQHVLADTLKKPFITQLAQTVEAERVAGIKVYPSRELVFNAFAKTPFDKVKVVIMGQDPYHGPGQAHGLSFSVPDGVRPPPSLKNIYQELSDDLSIATPTGGCLIKWAEQGVLLLNATLTVRDGKPLSHHNIGWELFTDAVIEQLVKRDDPVIFVLWGKNAQEKCRLLLENVNASQSTAIILKAPHPSPYSANTGFFGCKHFSKINAYLSQLGKNPINWELK